MEEILTPEMKEVIASLGALIKADARCADLYAKNGEDEAALDLRDTIQDRIDTLYNAIVAHPVYVAYVDAKNAFDALTNEVYGELQFVITGKRPCAHDCSSCGSDCHHHH